MGLFVSYSEVVVSRTYFRDFNSKFFSTAMADNPETSNKWNLQKEEDSFRALVLYY